MPTSFRTSTWSRIMRSILEESTTVIIMGSPSGTATTTMLMDSVSACIRCPSMTGKFVSTGQIPESCMPPSVQTERKKSAANTRIAARYPKRLMTRVNPFKRTLSGLSRVSSCICCAISP